MVNCDDSAETGLVSEFGVVDTFIGDNDVTDLKAAARQDCPASTLISL